MVESKRLRNFGDIHRFSDRAFTLRGEGIAGRDRGEESKEPGVSRRSAAAGTVGTGQNRLARCLLSRSGGSNERPGARIGDQMISIFEEMVTWLQGFIWND